MNDDNFVMIRYSPIRRGAAGVVGITVFPSRISDKMRRVSSGWVFDYGHHSQGEVFLVHTKDIQSMPSVFVPVRAQEAQRVVRLPKSGPVPRPRPVPLTAKPTPTKTAPTQLTTAPLTPAQEEPAPFNLQYIPGISKTLAASMRLAGFTTPQNIVDRADELTQIQGIGPAKAKVIIAKAQELVIPKVLSEEEQTQSTLDEIQKILGGVA